MENSAKILLFLIALVATALTPSIPSTAAATETEGKAVYDKACGTCHNRGIAGAPKLGVPADWSARIDKGVATLIEHAINGFQGEKGMMPARGGHSSLSDAEVEAAVKYMVGQSS